MSAAEMASADGPSPLVDEGCASEEASSTQVQSPRGSPQDFRRGCHCLEFDSWWNEGNTRRYVYIRYNITEGAFQIAIDEDSNLYHVPIVYGARFGEAITVWDMHVGAEVDILGRMTTLHHCSQMTAQWNKYWADRLFKIRDRLIEELRKYDTRKSEPWLTWNKKPAVAGGVDLRLLMNQVVELQHQLNDFRPRLAEQLGLPKEMYAIEELHRRQEFGALRERVDRMERARSAEPHRTQVFMDIWRDKRPTFDDNGVEQNLYLAYQAGLQRSRLMTFAPTWPRFDGFGSWTSSKEATLSEGVAPA